jgi:hypothetical protein
MKATGNPLTPAYYWSAALIVGIIGMNLARESAPCKAAKPATPRLELAIPDESV